ncbi:MAG: GGDEF domain-containing protein [Gammaproteobacteria bacterium]|nr:GGDEF domain-containing protein [Gammaproteobacteria bacterium PRO8]MCL4777520.1 GGDEF domain-containing protein [Gammaproteobacteria bacterium]
MSQIQIPEKMLQRLKTCTSFPSPPAVAMQVIALAQDPEIDLARVADTVSADPAIAAKVMRIANSAMYARRRQSNNLRQALIVLGLNATLTLALSFTLVSTLRRDSSKGFDFNAYWKRAILAATWGKLLASEFGRRDAEEVFLAALLQDIGMLALDKLAPDTYAGISPFQLEHGRVSQHEQSCLETDHRSVGTWLLKSWNLPASLLRGVQHSHDPTAGGVEPEHREFVRCVALSGDLADVWLTDQSETGIRRAGQQAQRHLGILPNRLAEMFGIIREQIPVAEGLFDLQLFPADQLQDIVESAKEILMVRNLYQIDRNSDLENQKSKLKAENSVLKVESERDGLTGVFNRRAFEEAMEREFAAAAKNRWPLSVVFVDLDHFKGINDTHGHQSGDAMLKTVATLLVSTLRDTDIVARYGGDEFVLLLPGADTPQVEAVAERLVQRARETRVDNGNGNTFSITLSLGIASRDGKSSFATSQELLAAADAALYHSKRNGRNRHTSYDKIKAA